MSCARLKDGRSKLAAAAWPPNCTTAGDCLHGACRDRCLSAATAARALRLLRSRELSRVLIELRLASQAAEVVRLPGVLRRSGRPAGVYLHSADRINLRCGCWCSHVDLLLVPFDVKRRYLGIFRYSTVLPIAPYSLNSRAGAASTSVHVECPFERRNSRVAPNGDVGSLAFARDPVARTLRKAWQFLPYGRQEVHTTIPSGPHHGSKRRMI